MSFIFVWTKKEKDACVLAAGLKIGYVNGWLSIVMFEVETNYSYVFLMLDQKNVIFKTFNGKNKYLCRWSQVNPIPTEIFFLF